MAEVEYYGILLTIKDILEKNINKSDFGNRALVVDVEDDINVVSAKTPYVNLQLTSWETPDEGTKIGGNTPYRTFLVATILCIDYSLKDREACKLRDKLLRKVKEVLKANVDLEGAILHSTFNGGKFAKDKKGLGFFKGVSIELQMEVRE